MVRYAGWLACEAEGEGRIGKALGHVLEGWRLLVGPGATGMDPTEMQVLSRAWRRLALEGTALEEAEGRRILASLAEVIAALPPLETTFSRAALTSCAGLAQANRDALGWREVERLFRGAFARMAMDATRMLGIVLERLLSRNNRVQFEEFRDVRHLDGPCARVLAHLQYRASRTADRVQVQQAYFSRILALLREGQPDRAQQTGQELRQAYGRRPVPSRFFDRPAVWRSLTSCPDLSSLLDEARASRSALESCRLVLALRLYRDRHGGWPDRLEAL